MMKRILALLLAAAMCLSLTACAGGRKGSKEDICLEPAGDGYCLNFPSSALFKDCIIKADITQDNWQEYFEDYEYTEHVVETNDFGEIEEEYDVIRRGFGLKRSIIGLVDFLSFKFDGITEFKNDEYKVVKKANQTTCDIYNSTTNEFLGTEELTEVSETYLIEFSNSSRKRSDIHLEEHTFIDVIGTIYIIDIPAGIYNGEDILQINFGPDGKNGGTGFGIGNILLYYED